MKNIKIVYKGDDEAAVERIRKMMPFPLNEDGTVTVPDDSYDSVWQYCLYIRSRLMDPS